ncbi:hypothetical protein ACOZ38_27805 [Sphaerisporangium viridialbum]
MTEEIGHVEMLATMDARPWSMAVVVGIKRRARTRRISAREGLRD